MTKAEYWTKKISELPDDCEDVLDDIMAWQNSDGKWEWEKYSEKYAKIVDQGRWRTTLEAVLEFDDGSLMRISWDKPSTENCDSFKNYEPEVVEAYEKTIIDYRPVK